MSETVAVIVTAAATLAGAALGLGGSWMIARRERRQAQRDLLRLALGAYLAALYQAVASLRDMPDVRPGLAANLVDRLRGDAATWLLTQRRVAALGPGPREERARVVGALAQLQVMPMPAKLAAAVDTSAEYLADLAESRDAEVVDRWPAVYQELHDAKRQIDRWRGR